MNFPIHTLIALTILIIILSTLIYLTVLIIKALRKYLRSSEVRTKRIEIQKTLGERLKEYRTECKMTQEFVAERLGVSRQAVSKWESGITDPSTSNLISLAKLYEVSVEDILRDIK